jgi:hypothetical protein
MLEKVPLFRQDDAKSLRLGWKTAYVINTMEW